MYRVYGTKNLRYNKPNGPPKTKDQPQSERRKHYTKFSLALCLLLLLIIGTVFADILYVSSKLFAHSIAYVRVLLNAITQV